MIVNPTQTGWEVIYHRAHALLAAQIAFHWREDERPTRWPETLAAVAQHDDGGREWEGENHLTEGGAPLDFTLSTSLSLVQPREVATNSQYQGRWVALLTSMHISFLYEPMRGESGEVAEFLDVQRANQKRWKAELGVSDREADDAYAILRFCDTFSLILCGRKLPDGGRALEIGTGPGGTSYAVFVGDDGVLVVDPWPFATPAFEVRLEASYLDQFTFKDDTALQAALRAARIDTLTWTLKRSG